jgi:hypothetical protein
MHQRYFLRALQALAHVTGHIYFHFGINKNPKVLYEENYFIMDSSTRSIDGSDHPRDRN